MAEDDFMGPEYRARFLAALGNAVRPGDELVLTERDQLPTHV